MGFRVQRNMANCQADGSGSTATSSSWARHEFDQAPYAFDDVSS